MNWKRAFRHLLGAAAAGLAFEGSEAAQPQQPEGAFIAVAAAVYALTEKGLKKITGEAGQ